MLRVLTILTLGLLLLGGACACKGLDLGGLSDGSSGGGNPGQPNSQPSSQPSSLVQLDQGQTAAATGIDGGQLDVNFSGTPALGVHLQSPGETTAMLKFINEQDFNGILADAANTTGRGASESFDVTGGDAGLALALSGMDQATASLTFGAKAVQLTVAAAPAGAPALSLADGPEVNGQATRIVTAVVGGRQVRFSLRRR